MDRSSQFFSFLRQASDLAEIQSGTQAFQQKAIQEFLYSMSLLRDTSQKNEMLRELASSLLDIDSFHAGMLALLCGTLVERGGDVTISVNATLELLARQLPKVQEFVHLHQNKEDIEHIFTINPNAVRAHSALPFLTPAVMTMLSRDKEVRKQWKQREDVITQINALASTDTIPWYLQTIFSLLDDKDLLVLDQMNKRGFLTRLIGVQDVMYHCYALLQQTLLEHVGPGYLDAQPTDPDAVRYAQNRDMTPEDYQKAQNLYDEQRFGFRTPGGLVFFPGSAQFAELSTLDGLPLLLVEKKTASFSWQPSNMYPILHEALKPRVEMVRELTSEEVNSYLQRLA